MEHIIGDEIFCPKIMRKMGRPRIPPDLLSNTQIPVSRTYLGTVDTDGLIEVEGLSDG